MGTIRQRHTERTATLDTNTLRPPLLRMSSVDLGNLYERKAEQFLTARGLRLLLRNYRCRGGEIDLIMQDAKNLVFVEVRYRKNVAHGSPLESVTSGKQRRIIRAAQHFMMLNPVHYDKACRFDAVGISGDQNVLKFDWIKSAFSA